MKEGDFIIDNFEEYKKNISKKDFFDYVEYNKETLILIDNLELYKQNTAKPENKMLPEYLQAEIIFRERIINADPATRRALLKIFNNYEDRKQYLSGIRMDIKLSSNKLKEDLLCFKIKPKTKLEI